MLRARNISLPCVLTLCLTGPARAQDEPWNRHDWGSMESVRTLFQPATRIEFKKDQINFLASRLQYVFRPEKDRWDVISARNSPEHFEGWGMAPGVNEITTSTGNLTFSQPGPGQLEFTWEACSRALGPISLWTASHLGQVWLERMQKRMSPRPTSAQDLAARMCTSDADVKSWAEDERSLWLGISFYAGEGCGGVGTILHINRENCALKVHQPSGLGVYSTMHMAIWEKELWLATGDMGESGWHYGIGLVRFDPESVEVRPYPDNHPLRHAFVTAMAREDRTLWLATPGGFFALDLETQRLRSWRIVPRLDLARSSPVSNLPGGEVQSWLEPGKHEVRWLGPSYAEVITPDCAEGLAEKAWVDDPGIRGSANLMEIGASGKWGNPSSLRIYSAPQDLRTRPQPMGWFLRVPVEPIGSPEGDWQRARVCAGWVKARPEDVRLTVEEVR